MISQTIDYSPQKHGPHRARFEFTIDDGRKVLRGPVNVASEQDADIRRVSMEAGVLVSVQNQDAAEAVTIGTKTAYKLATAEQVQYAWLESGFNESEHYNAYEKMKDIGPQLLALGLTDEQYAAMFDTEVESVINVKDYWSFLDANSTAIETYLTIEAFV